LTAARDGLTFVGLPDDDSVRETAGF